jgi:histidyl-tRNA synthetase
VGGDEEKEGYIKIKNMETGEEKTVEAGKLLEFIT